MASSPAAATAAAVCGATLTAAACVACAGSSGGTPTPVAVAEAPAKEPAPARAGRRTAFATLTTNDAYMVGVVALYRSLRRVGALSADRPLIVMITDEVTAAAKDQLQLAADACDKAMGVRSSGHTGGAGGFVLTVVVDAQGNPAAEQGERAKKRFDSVYTKLGVWGLDTYADVVVFLDADMVVLRDLPELFDLVPPTAPAPYGSIGAMDQHRSFFAASAYEPYSCTYGAKFFDSACMVPTNSIGHFYT